MLAHSALLCCQCATWQQSIHAHAHLDQAICIKNLQGLCAAENVQTDVDLFVGHCVHIQSVTTTFGCKVFWYVHCITRNLSIVNCEAFWDCHLIQSDEGSFVYM